MNFPFSGSHPFASLQDIEYFNIEVSRCRRVLVVNGNKQGIDRFYHQCLSISSDSGDITLQTLPRPQRRWHSWSIEINPAPLATDPSIFHTDTHSETNRLANELRVRFLKDASSDMIFHAILKDDNPILIVNKKGWNQFLNMLLYLRDSSKWFYVVPKNRLFTRPLLFEYRIPKNKIEDSLFGAIECIRLEPEEEVLLYTSLCKERIQAVMQENDPRECGYLGTENTIRGNTTGLLYLSYSLRNFALEESTTKDVLNPWDPNHSSLEQNWIHLRKVHSDSNNTILSFQTKLDEQHEFYIFGNEKGLISLANIIEKYAFRSDSDHLVETESHPYEGDLTPGRWGGDDFYPLVGWYLCGGSFQSHLYDPSYFAKSDKPLINEKVVYV